MRQFLKFAAALGIALTIVMAIRLFAFTIYTAPVSIGKDLKTGGKVVVSKLSRYGDFKKGDIVVFVLNGDAPLLSIVGPPQEIGVITSLPGDTITVRGNRYLIPLKCCDRCPCHDCKLYLVNTGNAQRLVHKHQIMGKGL